MSLLHQPLFLSTVNYHIGHTISVRVAEELGYYTDEGFGPYVFDSRGLLPGPYEGVALALQMEQRGVDVALGVGVAAALKRFIKANVEGVYKGLSDEKWGKEVIGKQFQTDNKEVIDEAYAALKANYPRDFGLSSEAVTNVINEVNTMGPPLKYRNPANYVDNSYSEQLKREGFFDEMKRKYKL